MLKQRTQAPDGYPTRIVGQDVLDWDDDKYKPIEYNADVLTSSPKPAWADPAVVLSSEVGSRLIFDIKGNATTVSAICKLDEATDRFLNPFGHTGVRGRGLLGCWGPNHAADNIVTRRSPEGTGFEVMLVRKRVGDSSSCLAFPAGMVDPGKTVVQTMRAELTQEAVVDDSGTGSSYVDRLFSSECDRGSIYKGQVDDWRNTDNAWMVTTANWFHATPEVAAGLRIGVADTEEIESAAWYRIDKVETMYASHQEWLDAVKAKLTVEFNAKSTDAYATLSELHSLGVRSFGSFGIYTLDPKQLSNEQTRSRLDMVNSLAAFVQGGDVKHEVVVQLVRELVRTASSGDDLEQFLENVRQFRSKTFGKKADSLVRDTTLKRAREEDAQM